MTGDTQMTFGKVRTGFLSKYINQIDDSCAYVYLA